MKTVPQQAQLFLNHLANTCARRNLHRWQDYYINTKVYVVHNAVVILTTCTNHALGGH